MEAGAAAVRQDPTGFARIQWDTWSPTGWFDEAEFRATAALGAPAPAHKQGLNEPAKYLQQILSRLIELISEFL